MHHAGRTLEQNDFASKPCRDASVDPATIIPAIGSSPLPHLERSAAAYQEEYGGSEYGGLPVKGQSGITFHVLMMQRKKVELLRNGNHPGARMNHLLRGRAWSSGGCRLTCRQCPSCRPRPGIGRLGRCPPLVTATGRRR